MRSHQTRSSAEVAQVCFVSPNRRTCSSNSVGTALPGAMGTPLPQFGFPRLRAMFRDDTPAACDYSMDLGSWDRFGQVPPETASLGNHLFRGRSGFTDRRRRHRGPLQPTLRRCSLADPKETLATPPWGKGPLSFPSAAACPNYAFPLKAWQRAEVIGSAVGLTAWGGRV